MDSAFDQHSDAFRSYQATPWGRLRYEQSTTNLTRHLPNNQHTVLDVGAGNGLDAVRLAALGHRVTVVDTSRASLAEAASLAETLGYGGRIETRLADVADLSAVAERESFDVVMAHNVLQYVPDQPDALAEMVSMLRPGGFLSVLGPNPHCDPLAAAVRSGDLGEALRLLDSPTRTAVTYGLDYPAQTADEMTAHILAAGMNPPARYGIRSVCDLIDDQNKHDPQFFDQLLHLENALADRRPYIDTARFFHLIATKPDSAADAAAHEVRRRRVEMDLDTYEAKILGGPCFVCEFLSGTAGFEHETVYDDGDHVGFLNKYPTLPASVLVVPRRHVEDVVRDLDSEEYLHLQAAVHTVARAVAAVTDPERVYVFSMGSKQANAHVHWHITPLPAGIPYRDQQFRAVDASNGILAYTPQESTNLGHRIRAALTT